MGPRKDPEPRVLLCKDRKLGKKNPSMGTAPWTSPGCRVLFPVGQGDRGAWGEGSVLTHHHQQQASLAGKETEPSLPLVHKSRLLTREDQIAAVK